ncbi:hypothetical protein Scep_023918 [Stephania cephalantha]|uniref:Uncharacterized protein n=1 Tax=Stephania cephalantha TaxID=152367 RepID=A0AAP0F116_9MAGN
MVVVTNLTTGRALSGGTSRSYSLEFVIAYGDKLRIFLRVRAMGSSMNVNNTSKYMRR